MNKFLLALIVAVFSYQSLALEPKALVDVSINDLTTDTQAQPDNAGDDHLALVWWVPQEYWASVFARDPNVSAALRNEMLNILDKYTLIAIVQADVTAVGTFNFYSRKYIAEQLNVSYQSEGETAMSLVPEANVSNEMQMLMGQITPILKAAMGNMGANFHFFIYPATDESGHRVADPYQRGRLSIDFVDKKGTEMAVAFNMPLNSLYVPRICPNGQSAHISWNFCPWSGKKL